MSLQKSTASLYPEKYLLTTCVKCFIVDYIVIHLYKKPPMKTCKMCHQRLLPFEKRLCIFCQGEVDQFGREVAKLNHKIENDVIHISPIDNESEIDSEDRELLSFCQQNNL